MSMDQSYMWHSYVYHFTPSVYIYFQICFGKTLRYNHNKIYGMLWALGGDCIILISTYKEINMLGNCPVGNCPVIVLISFHQSESDCWWLIVGLNVAIPIIK